MSSEDGVQVVLIAVAGGETHDFWRALSPLLPPAVSVELLHVVDEQPRREIGLQRLRRPGHGPLPTNAEGDHLPPDRERRIEQAETAGQQAILDAAAAALGRRAGARSVRFGRPEREIVAHAVEHGIGLVVLGARPYESPTPSGPHSIGHVARFVVDHAPCPVLVVRIPRR